METYIKIYRKEQIDSIERYLFEIENNYLNLSSKFKKIREILSSPVSSEKDKEPYGWVNGLDFFKKGHRNLPDSLKDKAVPVYFSPVLSNRIGLEELRGDFIQWVWGNGKISADQVFDWFLPHLSISDEEKKPIEEITDEDAIEVDKIINPEYITVSNYYTVTRGKIWVSDLFKGLKVQNSINVYQYLQSKNYQLPKFY